MTEAEKKAQARRRQQNAGIKAGTVRLGAKGKTVRRYNPKTGRWDVTKSNVKPGVSLRPTKKSNSTTPPSLTKPTNSRTTSRAPKRLEGPKRPTKDTRSAIDKFASKGVLGSLMDRGTGRITTNKVSDFPRGTKLHLSKQRNKDAQNRDVYRWVTGAAAKPSGVKRRPSTTPTTRLVKNKDGSYRRVRNTPLNKR